MVFLLLPAVYCMYLATARRKTTGFPTG